MCDYRGPAPAAERNDIAGRFHAEALGLDDAGLESNLCLLAGNLNAASYRFCVLVAECDRRELWAQQGAQSCAYWLGWLCGLSAHAARERLRVGHALEGLPSIASAFAAGTVSFSKVRAVTRVATPETEETLLSIALHGTAHHVERLVSAYRGAVRAAENERAERQREARRLAWHVDEEGMVVIEGRFPAELGARVVKAIERAVDEAEADHGPQDEPGSDNPHSPNFEHRPVDLENARLGSLADSAPHQRPLTQLVSMKRADALVRLADAYLDGGGDLSRSPSERYQVMVHVDAESFVDPAEPGRADLDGRYATAAETARRIACDSSLVPLLERLGLDGTQTLDIGRKTRAIPPAMRRALDARDQGCRFPGCIATRHVEGHHIHHWANGGRTALDNLVLLCHHHHALVHEGGYTIERKPCGTLLFLRPDGTEVPLTAPSLQATASLADEHQRREIHIDHRTGRPRWDGQPMDLGLAVEVVLQRSGRVRDLGGNPLR